MIQAMKSYEHFGRLLAEQAPTVFGLMGDANMQYLSAYVEANGRFISVTHEGAAVSMADGYSRASGRVGVASVTHGPALTNTLTALTEAARYRSGMVLLTGSTSPGRNVFQDFDIESAVYTTGAGFERIEDSESLQRDLGRAIRRAAAERRPIVLDYPFPLLGETTSAMPPSSPQADLYPGVSKPSPVALEAAAEAVMSMKRPVVLAGLGAMSDSAREAASLLAHRIGAPLVTTLLARGLFQSDTNDLGLMGGLTLGPAIDVLRQADGFIVLGAGLNRFTAGDRHDFTTGRTIVQCDNDPDAFGKSIHADVAVVGDAALTAAALTERLPQDIARQESVMAQCSRAQSFDPKDHYTQDWSGYGLSIREASFALQEVLPLDKYVVSDLGRFLATSWRHIYGSATGTFTHTGTFGSIGLGLSTSLGVAEAQDRPVVALVGDGGLMMSIGELSTAARHNIPVLVVVFNDGAYGAEYSKLDKYGLDPNASLMAWPDLAGLATQMGLTAFTATSVEEIKALPLGSALTGPTLVDVRVDPRIEHFEW